VLKTNERETESNNQELGKKSCLQAKITGVVMYEEMVEAVELIGRRFYLVGINSRLL